MSVHDDGDANVHMCDMSTREYDVSVCECGVSVNDVNSYKIGLGMYYVFGH